MRGSEVAVAQPVSEIVAITRAASCRIQHLALDVIDLLRGFEAFGKALARREFERVYAEDPAFEDVAQRLGVGE